jgi:hypothetical protein
MPTHPAFTAPVERRTGGARSRSDTHYEHVRNVPDGYAELLRAIFRIPIEQSIEGDDSVVRRGRGRGVDLAPAPPLAW